MGIKYVILGSGRQGAASAYDLAVHGEAESITLCDQDADLAKRTSERINLLSGSDLATSTELDVADSDGLIKILDNADVCISAVPYQLNFELTKAAVENRSHFCDLGGNTDIVRQQLTLDEPAKSAGVAVVPDCGLAPGMGNSLALYALEQLELSGVKPEGIRMYCGGLPQNPKPPLDYALFFSMEGLINEYDSQTYLLADGKIQQVEPLEEIEDVQFEDPALNLEAFLTSGGTSIAPWRYEGNLKHYVYKTLRYPGHCAKVKSLRDLGLFGQDEFEVKTGITSAREAVSHVLNQSIPSDDPNDIVLLRVVGSGIHAETGQIKRLQVDLVDYHDQQTGFTAMERTTGFSTAIVAHMMGNGTIKPGAATPDPAVRASPFVEALRKRGFDLREQFE